MSPVHKVTGAKRQIESSKTVSAQASMRSCSAAELSGVVIETNSHFVNWRWRSMPRVSRPAAPASERKQGVSAVNRFGNASVVEDLLTDEVGQGNFGGRDEPQASRGCGTCPPRLSAGFPVP